MTILFIVFVVLYALADINEETWERFSQAMASRSALAAMGAFDQSASAINDLMGSGIIALPDIPMQNFRPQTGGDGSGGQRSQMEIVGEALQTYFGEIGMADNIDVRVSEGGDSVEIVIGEGIGQGLGPGAGPPGTPQERRPMFNSGSSAIREEFYDPLRAIAGAIAGFPNVQVAIAGHTDNVPVSRGSRYADNRELSSARALNVLRFIYGLGVIEADRIIHIGHGEYRPIDTNDTAEGRQHNRRVEIILTHP
jgi:chemotaxis protein MotB